jgi:hypothetical protein
MKMCTYCEVEKPFEEFNTKSGTQLRSRCRDCSRALARDKYHANRELNAERQKLSKKARMNDIKSYIRDLKENTPCNDCAEHYAWYVMDFDHVNGKKTTHISEMVAQGAAKWKIMSEITKCDVVCANCHRERTFGRIGLSKTAVFE